MAGGLGFLDVGILRVEGLGFWGFGDGGLSF